jgi:PAS domain S-box-containing protein
MTIATFDRWLLGAGGLIALLVTAVVLTFLSTRQLHRDAGGLAHSYAVLDALEEVQGHLREGKAILHSYLLTGDDSHVPEIAAKMADAKSKLKQVKDLTCDNPQQQDRIAAFEKGYEELAVHWARPKTMRKKQASDTATQLAGAVKTRRLDDLQWRLREMVDAERSLLREQTATVELSYRRALVNGLGSGLATLAGLTAFLLLLRRQLAQRTAAAAVIAEQSEWLRTTLASIGDAVVTTDTRGCITSMNAVAEALTGWPAATALGQPLGAVFCLRDEQTRQSVEDPATQALREGIIVGLADHPVLIAKDGTERPIDDCAAPIRGKDGQIAGCVLVFRDVTEGRQTEQELRRSRAEIQQRNQQLAEGDRRKDEFLATLAHELRNPLAPIRNALQIIRLSPDRECREQVRTMMERQLDQMVRLVDDLLDVSRITRGMLELRREQVPLAAVLSNALETSRPRIDLMGHELTVTLPPPTLLVEADLTRLAQVFANLLNNSAKYMDRGGRIWLTAVRDGSDVVVSVKDTGIGIAAEQLPHLFQMYSQAEHALERSQGGLGIGLTLVKRLVEMHEGKVEARSDGLGKGAEFVVRLPVATEAAAAVPVGEKDHPAALKSSLRILIVDDNRDGADSLAMLLRIMGNTTRTAYDGQEGVAVAEAFRPNVIVLDLGLPNLNGYEACRRIRAQAWGKSVVLIAVTGWGQEEDRRRSQEAGFDQHLVKPVDPNALMKLLAGLPAPRP